MTGYGESREGLSDVQVGMLRAACLGARRHLEWKARGPCTPKQAAETLHIIELIDKFMAAVEAENQPPPRRKR